MPLSRPIVPAAEPPLIHLSTDYIRAKEYFEAIVSSTSDAICTTDLRGCVMYFSPGAEAMFGIGAAEIVGRSAHGLYAGGREEARRLMALLRRDGRVRNYETTVKGSDGKTFHISLSLSMLRDRSGRSIGTIGVSKDISERVELERRLRELSITDELTGLFNQRFFMEKLEQEIQRARRQRHRLSLVLADLDGFKRVNDTKGHLAGDALLRNFGETLRKGIREHVDSAFRYGGDEFIVLLPGLSAPQAQQVVERLSAQTRLAPETGAPFSYGVATFPTAGSGTEMLRAADRRMYRMKQSRGRSTV